MSVLLGLLKCKQEARCMSAPTGSTKNVIFLSFGWRTCIGDIILLRSTVHCHFMISMNIKLSVLSKEPFRP